MTTKIALVMAGGGGTRLWPVSTPARPKQLIPDLPVRGTTLLGATVDRIVSLVGMEQVYIITTIEQAPAIRAQLPELPAKHVIAEPYGRNTAPCIALSLVHIRALRGDDVSDSVVIALPSDHYVADEPGFRAHLKVACQQAAASNAITLLGIQPTGPETGYGYICCGDQVNKGEASEAISPTYRVQAFVEKPDEKTAQAYLEKGNYLWNAGIFAMPFKRVEAEFKQHCGATWSALENVAKDLSSTDVATKAYDAIKPEPFDTAIMEQQTDAWVVPFDGGWSDLGSWSAIKDTVQTDATNNAIVCGDNGQAVLHDSRDCLVWNEDAKVGVLGMQGVAVIASGGRILVCPVQRAQEVRKIVDGFDTD